ncbi:MAG TPA: hypothetical protein VJZ00_12450 [Thermoanaerobaculia bacterium]|nr:hypothetical protein [Thermoanaerobaculia bacterium]
MTTREELHALIAQHRESGNTDRLAHAIRHLADMHRRDGELALAEPLYVEALALYRANPATKKLDLANAVRPFAILRGLQGAEEESRQLWTEARDLYAECGIEAGVAEATRRLG